MKDPKFIKAHEKVTKRYRILNNILDFLFRAVFSVVVLSIVSSVLILSIQAYTKYDRLAPLIIVCGVCLVMLLVWLHPYLKYRIEKPVRDLGENYDPNQTFDS